MALYKWNLAWFCWARERNVHIITEVLYFIILFEPVLKSGHLSKLFLARSFL